MCITIYTKIYIKIHKHNHLDFALILTYSIIIIKIPLILDFKLITYALILINYYKNLGTQYYYIINPSHFLEISF